MSKGKGGGNNGQKAAATGINANIVMSPETIRKDNKSFGQHMAEAAATAFTGLVASGVMYGVVAGGQALFSKLGWFQTGTPQHGGGHVPQQQGTQQPATDGRSKPNAPDHNQILDYAKMAKAKLEEDGSDVTATAIQDMVLEYNDELVPFEGKVRGVIGTAYKKDQL